MLHPRALPKGSSVGSLMSAGCLQVKGIPFLVFDAGGVLEMFDPKEFSDNVVFEPTLAALKRKLSSVVSPNASFISCAFFGTEIRCILAERLRQGVFWELPPVVWWMLPSMPALPFHSHHVLLHRFSMGA